MKFYVILILLSVISRLGYSQHQDHAIDSLRKEILSLRNDVDQIQLNLVKGEKKFKRGILVATIGYSITITGGLMLGRKQDDLGKALLVAGGTTGIVGTVLMVDSFKYLGRAGKKK